MSLKYIKQISFLQNGFKHLEIEKTTLWLGVQKTKRGFTLLTRQSRRRSQTRTKCCTSQQLSSCWVNPDGHRIILRALNRCLCSVRSLIDSTSAPLGINEEEEKKLWRVRRKRRGETLMSSGPMKHSHTSVKLSLALGGLSSSPSATRDPSCSFSPPPPDYTPLPRPPLATCSSPPPTAYISTSSKLPHIWSRQ